MGPWKKGDWAVYRKSKQGTNPGRRAAQVVASPKGETYRYVVDKFWVVDEVLDDGKLRLMTARGKLHTIAADDPNLRRPGLLQKFLWRERFVQVEVGREMVKPSQASPIRVRPASDDSDHRDAVA